MTVIGTLIGERFRLEEKVGSGGMSSVYRAYDPTPERRVAIKMMHRDISSDPDQLERFRREARAVAQLNHPHVVTVIDAGEDEGAPYIVFEYVEGETLKERIRRLGRLPIDEAIAYAIEIGRALECAHTHKLVHRDVKPQNVLIDRDGRAKVTDFGIARSMEAQGLTATGRVLGTTDYVSPEQALGHEVTEQSDIYSLGVVLYEMLTGEATGEATTVLRTLSGDTADFAPQRLRHPKRALFLSFAVLVLVGAVIGYFATRTEQGPGPAATPSAPGLSEVRLSQDAADDYDPEGDGEESSGQVQFAIDGNPTTEWDTETYDGGFEASNKRGVGLYIDTGSRVAARQLDLVTSTPGFTAAVYASDSVPSRIERWSKVSQDVRVKEKQAIQLDTARQEFRNYLLWISELPEGGKAVVKELSLQR